MFLQSLLMSIAAVVLLCLCFAFGRGRPVWAPATVAVSAALVVGLLFFLLKQGPENENVEKRVENQAFPGSAKTSPTEPAPRGSHARGPKTESPAVNLYGLSEFLPHPLEAEYGYAGSAACRTCHVDEHTSWHHSYHRTMTQPAIPAAVKAPFDGVTLRSAVGWVYRLERRGHEFWIDMVDPDWDRQRKDDGIRASAVANPPRVVKRVVMTTGSHHKQSFWVPSSQGRFLCRVPWSYRLDQQRWIPLENDYLSPPNSPRGSTIWNDNCIGCHAVAGQPRTNANLDDVDTHVAELGISCEACHGPGQEHIRVHQQAQPRSGSDPTIVNPRNLSHQRSAQVCGHCHSVAVFKDFDQFVKTGLPYRPGDNLEESLHIVRYTERPIQAWLREEIQRNRHFLRSSFWSDGTIRVTGREYNGLLETACYQRGKLSCVSCHSMHGYIDREDQLGMGKEGNSACAECHTAIADRIGDHTHHRPDSTGSLCYNCHMPHTTYGLLKAIRSHRIDSPSAAGSVRTGRPNACNLCHLDKTLPWTAEYLAQWYDMPPLETEKLDEDEREVAASLVWLLRGDAAQRAITAWHWGWGPARETSGESWLAPFLAHLLDDDYSAVRNIAGRSLKTLPEFAEFEYDFLAPEKARAASVARVLDRWNRLRDSQKQQGDQILIAPSGELQQTRIDQLLKRRNRRAIYIAE